MDALVSLVEYFLTAIFCLFTVFFVIKTLITRTLAKTWKECPALVVFFLYVIALALGTTLMAVEWALVDLNLLSTKADFSLKLLHNSGVAGVSLRWCYDCATLGIVIQRIWYLKSPFAYLSGLKSLVLGFDITVPAFLVIGFVYINASSETSGSAGSDCHSFNCMKTYNAVLRLYAEYTQLTLSILIICAGTIFFVMMYRFRKRFNSSIDRKLNRFTGYVFYLRILCETVPYLVDIILFQTSGESLGSYIGGYGALGGSIDMFGCSLVYFLMTDKKRVRSLAVTPDPA